MPSLSRYVYFTYLCLVNILIINVDITYHYLLPYITDGRMFLQYVLPFTCKFLVFFTFFLRYIFIWLIVMINIDRCLYLTTAKLKLLICHPRSANIISLIIVIFSFLVNAHFFVFLKNPIRIETSPRKTCILDGFYYYCESRNRHFENFYKSIWPIYNVIIFALVPVFIIFICFLLIIRNIYLLRQRNTNDRSHSIGKTLICLDLLFPLTIFPVLFFQIYINYYPPKTCLNLGIINLILSIGYSMSFIKNTFAFLIFYFTGGKFRRGCSSFIYCKNKFAVGSTR
ncbi:unnamed protein product [Rotaria socialis]|uniref:G-protein coupled receptors family 1 profile domain-containing protein n=1 Tax=Rotaria socialis TaxID=392032 RepID=A0A817L9H9_9BILA|nr:unnamed protein product [Rotaria socialis]CAF3419606.1 unnamed protein product [Rotaria socialis]CAF3484526.1 unnamed protein product [Rotaria socialis]CAF4483909.1 unnamed protein product [Rotaria socialis]CAF4899432.1 unnamed protein product [Rotaria socialis]